MDATDQKHQDIVMEIKKRAMMFVLDNILDPDPRDILMIENAMLIGASVAFEKLT